MLLPEYPGVSCQSFSRLFRTTCSNRRLTARVISIRPLESEPIGADGRSARTRLARSAPALLRSTAALRTAPRRNASAAARASDGCRRTNASDAGSGTVSATLTGLYPWGRHALTERVSVWGITGYGEGTLTLTPANEDGTSQAALRTDLDLMMGAVGLRGTLLEAPETGGIELAVKTDALAVRTRSTAVTGPSGNLAGASAEVTRLRLGLESTRPLRFAGGAALTPRLEVGVRHDGGDGRMRRNGAGLKAHPCVQADRIPALPGKRPCRAGFHGKPLSRWERGFTPRQREIARWSLTARRHSQSHEGRAGRYGVASRRRRRLPCALGVSVLGGSTAGQAADLLEPCDYAQQGRLPALRGPDEDDELPLVDGEFGDGKRSALHPTPPLGAVRFPDRVHLRRFAWMARQGNADQPFEILFARARAHPSGICLGMGTSLTCPA